MKRVRCPKCDNYIVFDETKYESGQSLVFQCPECNKQFGIRLGISKLHGTQTEENNPNETPKEESVGSLIVIENIFGFKQVLSLHMGDNIIGRYQKGHDIQCPIESNDPSIDMHHCILTVQHDKKGNLKYILRDGPSYTGTFVGGEILGDKERRVISDGTLFTIGATSVILKTINSEED